MLEYPYPRAVERFPEIRQSLLQTFDNCGLGASFDIAYRRGWNTSYQGRGQIFHRVASECLREMALRGEETIPVDAALSILHDTLRQANVDRVCPTCGGGVKRGIGRGGMRTCRRGHKFETELVNVPTSMTKDLHWVVIKWANDNAFDIADLVEVEQRLKAELRYPDPFRGGSVPRVLTGQLDALFIHGVEEATVIDWKDMWAVPPPKEVSEGGYFQQRFYAWLIFRNYPTVMKVTLREFYVRYSATREATVWRTDEPALEDEFAALAERFDRAYEESAYVPTPGKHCDYCIRPSACPIPVFAREEGRIIDAKRAEQVARQLIVGERVVKKARAALREFAKQHGPIPIRDAKGPRAFGYVEVVRTEKPTLEQIQVAEREKGAPLTSSEIAQLYRKTLGTRFEEFRPKDEDPAAAEEKLAAQLRASIEAADERRTEAEAAEAAKVIPLDSVRRAS